MSSTHFRITCARSASSLLAAALKQKVRIKLLFESMSIVWVEQLLLLTEGKSRGTLTPFNQGVLLPENRDVKVGFSSHGIFRTCECDPMAVD